MSIDYTIVPGEGGPDGKGAWMTHIARAHSYETECDGCSQELPTYVRIITDRSGSEYSVAHDIKECIADAVAKLEGLEEG